MWWCLLSGRGRGRDVKASDVNAARRSDFSGAVDLAQLSKCQDCRVTLVWEEYSWFLLVLQSAVGGEIGCCPRRWALASP